MWILSSVCAIGGVPIPDYILNTISYVIDFIKIGVPLLLIIFGIVSINSSIELRAITILVGIIWFIELLVLPKINAKKVLKSSKISSEADVEFEFYEEKVVTKTIKDGKEMAKGELNYKELYKIVDLKKYIYLYISSNQAFICSKDKMDGNYNELSEILKSTLGKKYKI